MKRIFVLLIFVCMSIHSFSQTTIRMQREGGVSIVPCKINGLNLSFIFDTGASDVTMSLTEALFMLKNRYLSDIDIVGKANYQNATGELAEGFVINLREIEFAGLKLYNVRATIVNTLNAPLLLGQSAISKLGPVQIDLTNNLLTIVNAKNSYDFYSSSINNVPPVSNTTQKNNASTQVQDASIPKDAPVDVFMTDFKKNILPYEIVVFRSQANNREYQGITDLNGRFSTRLPAGDKYEIFILGFKDSTSYIVLDIPPLQGRAYYKDPFKIDIQFLPSKSFVLEDCNFETGKADLEEDSYKVIDELVAYLNRKEDVRIELGGHTDNVGSAKSNLTLSEARANTVRNYLIAKGIDPNRVTAKGYGFTKPIDTNKTDEGRATNRRTEVTILDNDGN